MVHQLTRVAATVAVCVSTAAVLFAATPCSTPGFVSPLSLDRGTAQRVAVAIADFNADGTPDIASLHRHGDSITAGRVGTILLDRGPNAFDAEPLMGPLGSDFATIAAADLNHDGRTDLVLAGNTALNVMLGNGDGTFRQGPTFDIVNVTGVVTGDFNEDGWTDIAAVQSNPGSVVILLADHNGGFAIANTIRLQSDGRAIAAGDFDGDHHLDVAVAHVEGVTAFFGSGNGSFGNGVSVWPLAATAITAGDVDHDGRPELLVGIGNGFNVFRANGRAFQSVSGLNTSRPVTSLAIADMDGDGTPDIVAVGGGDVRVFRGSGGGLFYAPTSFIGGPSAEEGAIADFNGDGRPDVITVNLDALDLSLLTNVGGGRLDAMTVIDGPGGTPSLQVGDINRDGIPDLVVTGSNSANIAIYPGRTDGTFDAAIVVPAGTGVRAARIADVNGDRVPDVVALSADSRSVIEFLFFDVGVFTNNKQTLSFTNQLCCIDTADLNGDGKSDLIFGQQQGGFGVSFGTSTGFSTSSTMYTTPAGVTALAVAPIDGDASPDVVVGTSSGTYALQTAANGKLSYIARLQADKARSIGVSNSNGSTAVITAGQAVDVFSADGGMNFRSGDHHAVPGGSAYATAVADINGDGNVDAVVSSYDKIAAASFVTPVVNRGNGSFVNGIAIETDNVPAALALADFNRDGTPDLVVATDGKIMFGAGRCDAPRVTLVNGIPAAGQQPLVANVTGGWPAGATYILRDGTQVLGTVAADANNPGVAKFLPQLAPGPHQLSVTVNFADGSSVTSAPMTLTVGGGRRRVAKP